MGGHQRREPDLKADGRLAVNGQQFPVAPHPPAARAENIAADRHLDCVVVVCRLQRAEIEIAHMQRQLRVGAAALAAFQVREIRARIFIHRIFPFPTKSLRIKRACKNTSQSPPHLFHPVRLRTFRLDLAPGPRLFASKAPGGCRDVIGPVPRSLLIRSGGILTGFGGLSKIIDGCFSRTCWVLACRVFTNQDGFRCRVLSILYIGYFIVNIGCVVGFFRLTPGFSPALALTAWNLQPFQRLSETSVPRSYRIAKMDDGVYNKIMNGTLTPTLEEVRTAVRVACVHRPVRRVEVFGSVASGAQ